MSLLPVHDALARILAGVKPLPPEPVPLARALRRVLARDLKASRDQPPFPSSAMDGYAVRAADVTALPCRLEIAGIAPAGHGFAGRLGPGQAVRIFTGAPVPRGADAVVLQEEAEAEGAGVMLRTAPRPQQFIRPRGLDFRKGETLLKRGSRLSPRDVGLAAAMNLAALPVRRRPRIAILATGDELVPPGARPRPDQIVSSNSAALAAMAEQLGAEAVDLGIAQDDLRRLDRAIGRAAGADILVTLGGASVGEHDLVREALARRGMKLGFWKIAMRPGKPLMFGRLARQRVLGLPGNPVSALVCARVLLQPLIRALLGLPVEEPSLLARLAAAVGANDSRQDYLRATLRREPGGTLTAALFAKQDSSMLRTLAEAHCLIVRPPFAEAFPAGAAVPILLLDS